jgi:hypothetical protein
MAIGDLGGLGIRVKPRPNARRIVDHTLSRKVAVGPPSSDW